MIYLSGKITGLDREDYLAIFERHEIKLCGSEKNKVINPALIMDTLPILTHGQYMEIALTLLEMCDTIYLIPGWEESPGAKTELEFALERGYKIIAGEMP